MCVFSPNGSTANSLAVNTQNSDMSLTSVKGGKKQGGFLLSADTVVGEVSQQSHANVCRHK